MIIKTGFTDGHHSWISCELAKRRRDVVVLNRLSGSWMNANDCENIPVFFGELNRAAAACNRCADRENSCYASVSCAPQDLIEISCELRIVEMGVSLD